MTETTELASAVDTTSSVAESSSAAATKSSGLAGLKLAQLQALASQLGISGGSRMRKGDLVTAISAHRAGTPSAKAPAKAAKASSVAKEAPAVDAKKADDTIGSAPVATSRILPRTAQRRRHLVDAAVAAAVALQAMAW